MQVPLQQLLPEGPQATPRGRHAQLPPSQEPLQQSKPLEQRPPLSLQQKPLGQIERAPLPQQSLL